MDSPSTMSGGSKSVMVTPLSGASMCKGKGFTLALVGLGTMAILGTVVGVSLSSQKDKVIIFILF